MNKIEVLKTPIEVYLGGSEWKEILLKDETKQITGAFKIRGVLNKFKNLKLYNIDTVITASTGNHAQAVALCAKRFGKKCIIVVPENTPKCKVNKISKYNPIIISKNLSNYEMCKEVAQSLAKENGYIYIPSFDDNDIIEGHKTLFSEIDWENIDYCFCPIGGGGLVSACIEMLKNTTVKIIGVEVQGLDSMNQSLLSGEKQRVEINNRANCNSAEGLLVSEVGDKTFEIAQNNKLKVCTVNEEEICDAIKKLSVFNNIKSEGAAAATLACALKYKMPEKRCVCIISGGNIDDEMYNKIIND